jgi:hypothetical protein
MLKLDIRLSYFRTVPNKVLICSFLALIIGIASIAPLVFLMSPTVKAETTPKPQFNIEIPYAYVLGSNSSVIHSIILEITLIDKDISVYDARIECFIIDFYSDKGYIGNISKITGTNYRSDYVLPDFYFSIDDWFEVPKMSGGDSFYYNVTLGEKITTQIRGGGTNWLTSFGEPEIITLSIRRLGWISFIGDSITATLASGEEVANVQLVKYEDGFLYNTFFIEEELHDMILVSPRFVIKE